MSLKGADILHRYLSDFLRLHGIVLLHLTTSNKKAAA